MRHFPVNFESAWVLKVSKRSSVTASMSLYKLPVSSSCRYSNIIGKHNQKACVVIGIAR